MPRPKSNLSEHMTTITIRMPSDGKDAMRRAAIKFRLTQDQIVGNAYYYAKQQGVLKLFKRNPPPEVPGLNPQFQVRILIEVAISIRLDAHDVKMQQGLFIYECWKFALENGFLESLSAGQTRKYIR
jgi:hypothetical protein